MRRTRTEYNGQGVVFHNWTVSTYCSIIFHAIRHNGIMFRVACGIVGGAVGVQYEYETNYDQLTKESVTRGGRHGRK